MEHSIHVSYGHFITTIGSKSTHSMVQKVKEASKFSSAKVDNLETDLSDAKSGEEARHDNKSESEMSDTIGTALALVKQVSI